MARAIEVPVVAKKGTLARSIEGEAATAFRNLGRSSGAVAPLGRMFGKITADADEFTKSIEASNARVLAFGASVAVINGVANAFKQLVAVTVNVEKSLTDINVVLNANQSQLSKFGDGLFKVAKNTAQSFDVVAEAATEFARQGLSLDETLKRTNDALILTRLTGLKAADSVKGLTAATNGFAKAGLTTTQIINKLAAVDVKFAVSADDLIAALSRTGAVAQDAGMSMDELIGMVTAAQQVTARGGPVIGNAFKTIFTRVQRPETLKTLRELKIAVEDTSGAALPASKVLQNLATSYDGLSRSAKDAVNQQVAGVFQINILKAAVGDLQKQNSIAARATAVSAGATDQATQKNQMLNQTISALTSQTGLALEELAKKIGDIAVAPGMRDLITSLKGIIEGTTGVLDGEGTGSNFARGLLKGIGNVLTGPGLIVIGGVFMKLFKDLTVFGMNSLKNLLGLNKAAQQQALLQKGIGQYLAGNVAYEQQMAAAAGNLNRQAAITQQFLAREIAMRQTAANLSAQMAAGAFAGGFRVKEGVLGKRKGRIPGFAPTDGKVPNFASIIDGPGNGKTYDVGRLPASITGGGSFNEPMTTSRFLKLSKLKSRSAAGGMTPLGGAMREYFDSQGITHITGQAGKAHIPFSGPKDARSFYQDVFSKPGPQGMNTSAIYERGLGLMKGKNSAFANDPVGAFYHAVNEAHPAPPGKSTNPTAVSIRGHFARGAFESEAIKRMGAQGFSHSNFIVDAARGGKPMEVKARMTESTRASILGKQFKMDQDVYNKAPAYLKSALDENIDRIHSRTKVQQLSSVPGSLEEKTFGRGVGRMAFRGKLRGFASNYAPNFSPIGEAIQREKLQVGAMMGVSPSSVKTRVVQNTSLRSSFNPGGFGVISPTVGQNSFADAARMHRGQDLRTVNLAPSLPVPGIDPMRPALSMTPTGYSDVIKTTIHGVTPEAGKILGSSIGKGIAREARLAPPPPMPRGITIPSSSISVPAPPAPGAGIGGAAMNAFMGYSMGTMVDPLAQDFLGAPAGALPGAIGGGMLGHAAGKGIASRLFGAGAKGMMRGGLGGAAIGVVGGALASAYNPQSRDFLARHSDVARTAGLADEARNMTGIGADKEVKRIKELFRSQLNLQRTRQLDRVQADQEAAVQLGRTGEVANIRSAAAITQRARSGGFSNLDITRQTAAARRATSATTRASRRGKFIGDAAPGLITKEAGLPYEGGGANELRIRNLIRENMAQGNFRAVDEFFQEIQNPDNQGMTKSLEILRKGVGINRGTQDFDPIETRGFFESGFSDSKEAAGAGVVNAASRSMMTGGTKGLAIVDNFTSLAQSDNFKNLAIDVKKAAESFDELEESMAFEEKIGALNDELAETAAAMENVNRFTSGFSSSFASAFSSITTGASSAKNAMMDFGINVFGTINKIQSERIGQMLTGAIFPEGGGGQGFLKSIFGGGKQRGGIIEAQNGMYISGGRTGDKNPAMLEDGEYVLNRNAVKAMGGPGALDSINFSAAPRFSRGGRLLSPISHSGVPKKSLNKILAEYEAPATLTDPRLSGFAHANDPTLQNVRGDIKEYHNKQIQKKFEKQAKKDQLLQTVVGAVVQTGIAQGLDFAQTKFKDAKLNKQALADESAVFGEDFDFGPLMTSSGPAPRAGVTAPGRRGSMPQSPGFNMIAGSADGPRLRRGDQAGMFERTAKSNAMLKDRENMLKSISRLEKGMSFNRSMAPMNTGGHGGHTKAMSDTFKKAGIKPGDRGAQQAYLQGLADSIASEFGVIGSRAVPDFQSIKGGTRGIESMLNRGRRLHDQLGGSPVRRMRDVEGKQRGGYIDNIPAMLTGGEFVMNSSAVRKHGSGFLNKLNRGGRIGYQNGGLVGDQSFVQAENGVTQQSNTSESTSNNTTINITVNSGGAEASVSTEGQPASKEKEMAMKIRGAVLSVIKEEKRTGGTLRDVTSET